MAIKIALVGNPNSGKTAMFNELTGSSQYVGNWPGVTVEKKEGKLKYNKDVSIVDLPGIYSFSPYTLEEVVSRDYLVNEKPDVIINIIDASNIERNLYLTTQISELNIPVIIALNMIDVVRKNGDKINLGKLSHDLGKEVVETSAIKNIGLKEATEKAVLIANKKEKIECNNKFSADVEKSILSISDFVKGKVDVGLLRFYAIKIFERDEKIIKELNLDNDTMSKIEKIILDCEKTLNDDSESIIINDRYTYITKIVENSFDKKNKTKTTTSDKIDKIVTNRWLAIPIFALVMFFVYYLSVSTVGAWATDWVNDTLFGDVIPTNVENFLVSVGAAPWLVSLLIDGIIGGVGAVLGFLPQMIILFFFLAILEDCGYMARIAFIMDRVFHSFGLSGKSFIPILIGTGCGVPGIMASRTIENENDRKMTIVTTTFIPCSAKLPIIALISGALFPGSIWVAPSSYFLGIIAIICSGIILKKTKRFEGNPLPFVMELPSYHIPSAKSIFMNVWDKSKSFVQKAGTVIFIACGLIWFLSSFDLSFQMVDTDKSILSFLGKIIAPLFSPLGWGDWKAAVATLTGLVAKENVVGTFSVLYGFSEASDNGVEIWSNLSLAFTQLSAYSFLIFNLLCAPCFAAMGAIKREMNDWRWTMFAISFQTALAYAVSFVFFQLALLITGAGAFTMFSFIAICLLGLFLFLLFRPLKKSQILVSENRSVFQ